MKPYKVNKEVPFKGIELREDGVYEVDGNEETKISKYIAIKDLISNIDTKDIKLNIEYMNPLGSLEEIVVSRAESSNPNSLMKYSSKGLDINQFNATKVVKNLINLESEAKHKMVHTQLGFSCYQDSIIYKHYNCIGVNSTYEGVYNIKPKGTIDAWLEMYQSEVKGNKYLEFICMVSLSALINGYIGEDLGLDSMITHIYANSSSGKTTSLKLAISIYGSPNLNSNSLFTNYNSTNNALIKQMTGMNGVTLALDEISMSRTRDFTNLIYTMSSGIDKARLDKESELKKKETWRLSIISNGEKSLVESSSKNAGIHVRVLEVGNKNWTSSAENSQQIMECINKNYGHLGFDMAELTIYIGKDKIIKAYNKNVNRAKDVLVKEGIVDTFTDRRAKYFGVIITTVVIFNQYLKKNEKEDFKIDIKGIMSVLVDIEKESILKRNFDKSAIDFINQYIESNIHKFQDKESGSTNRETLGTLIDKNGYVELQMLPNQFEKMLKEGGFQEKNVVLKELKEKELLSCDSDRYTRKRNNILGTAQLYIVVKIPKSNESDNLESDF
ncbi:DUF927 domain-containing protein [Metaclostridioides mangenotii]|uniref:DUF927 domain-containing protein n=1 Tax=Metaclostridioides mangenotii TaxID=1540 RepID=UPI000489B687|nr:DUF927 domain-containing protein [Clostridioides mangenotii]